MVIGAVIALVLVGVTLYRLVSGQLPVIEQDYGEGDPNEWEIR